MILGATLTDLRKLGLPFTTLVPLSRVSPTACNMEHGTRNTEHGTARRNVKYGLVLDWWRFLLPDRINHGTYPSQAVPLFFFSFFFLLAVGVGARQLRGLFLADATSQPDYSLLWTILPLLFLLAIWLENGSRSGHYRKLLPRPCGWITTDPGLCRRVCRLHTLTCLPFFPLYLK